MSFSIGNGSFFPLASTADVSFHTRAHHTMPLNSTPWGRSRQLAASVALLAAVLVICEWALRAVVFDHPRVADRRVVWSVEHDAAIRHDTGLYRFDAASLWSPRPGAGLPWTDGERINPDGFRGPQLPIERTPGVIRIATMGGGATLGVGVRWEDTYSARLVQILGEQGVRAEALCAGSEDFTVVQGLERWRHAVRVWRPHVVILTFVGARDLTQAPSGRSDAQRIELLRRDGAIREPGGLRDDMRPLHLASWLRDMASGVAWQERDVEYVELRLAPGANALDWPGQRRVAYDDYVKALSAFLREIREDGGMPMLLSVPRSPSAPASPVGEVYMSGALTVASWTNTRVLDGRSAFVRAVADEDVPPEDLFLGEMTPSECGHLSLAQALADEILSRMKERR